MGAPNQLVMPVPTVFFCSSIRGACTVRVKHTHRKSCKVPPFSKCGLAVRVVGWGGAEVSF